MLTGRWEEKPQSLALGVKMSDARGSDTRNRSMVSKCCMKCALPRSLSPQKPSSSHCLSVLSLHHEPHTRTLGDPKDDPPHLPSPAFLPRFRRDREQEGDQVQTDGARELLYVSTYTAQNSYWLSSRVGILTRVLKTIALAILR
jgi:hypothetical protein